jgi:hypothetical protein
MPVILAPGCLVAGAWDHGVVGWQDLPHDDDSWFTVEPEDRREEREPARIGLGHPFRTVLLAIVAVAIALVAWVDHSSRQRSTVTPTGTASRTSPSVASTSVGTAPLPAPTVTTLPGAGPPLGPTRPWDLFAMVGDELIRIEMASGRTTVVAAPPNGRGETQLVPLADRVIVQPRFQGEGYVVRDDGADRIASSGLPGAGVLVRALGTDRLWFARNTAGNSRLELVTEDGTPVPGSSITLPSDLVPGSVRSDGGLAVILAGAHGTYRVDRGSIRRITTGTVVGRGEEGWVVNECDDAHRCSLALVDRRTSARRPLGRALDGQDQTGSVAPDGRHVFLSETADGSQRSLLVDLATGHRDPLPGIVGSGAGAAPEVAWSPDSHWVVGATDDGTLVAAEVGSGRLVSLRVGREYGRATVVARYP